MKNITIRALSGFVYVALMVGTVLLGSVYFCLLCTLLMILGIIEFSKMTGRNFTKGIEVLVLLEDIIGGLLLLGSVLTYMENGVMAIALCGVTCWVIIFVIRCITELYTRNDNPLHELSISVFMQVYLGVGLGALSVMSESALSVLFLFVIIWSNDTGAYLVGCSFGRHRMFERVSPKKSWEGFFGGLVIACIIGMLFFWLTVNPEKTVAADWIKMLCFAVIVVIFGTWGDLIESLIKRSLHLKDSGNIIPGHGGILDRIDSLLLAAPTALIYCILTGFFVKS